MQYYFYKLNFLKNIILIHGNIVESNFEAHKFTMVETAIFLELKHFKIEAIYNTIIKLFQKFIALNYCFIMQNSGIKYFAT